MADVNPQGCYCGLRQSRPGFLESQGVPPGFCGFCQVCHRPGHIRHHPGSVPMTGSWCDTHYRRLAWTHPLAIPGCLVWLAALAAGCLAIVTLR